jgi:hypothetical protein
MKNQELTKLEFLLTVNDNIIVQRFFNVKNYNEKARNSEEFYYYLRHIQSLIQDDLKKRTATYMLDNKFEIFDNPQVMETSITDGPERFNIYVKSTEKVLTHRVFDAKIYPPKVRYTVDLRPHLKEILTDLTDIFSDENLSYEYLGLPLNV